MRVYRVEDIRGGGPHVYHGLGPYLKVASNNPEPYFDGIPKFTSAHVCGFESLEKLHQWFITPERRILHENKLRISVYEVDEKHVLHGRKQLMFIKAEATLIDRFGCLEQPM